MLLDVFHTLSYNTDHHPPIRDSVSTTQIWETHMSSYMNLGVHEKIKVATAAVRLLLEACSQIHYMQVQAELFCVYNFCCLYNRNAMQWFEVKIWTGVC